MQKRIVELLETCQIEQVTGMILYSFTGHIDLNFTSKWCSHRWDVVHCNRLAEVELPEGVW